MTDRTFQLTRRKTLLGLGSVGAAGAGAGLGTSALFSDEESFSNNTITAGTTNLAVEVTLVDASNEDRMGINFDVDESRVADGEVRTGIQVDDVKPGDYVVICTDVRVEANPMYVAAQARNVLSSENADDTPDEFVNGADSGELEANAEVTFGWDDGTPNDNSFGGSIVTSGGSAPEFEGTLAEFLQFLKGGLLYRGDGSGSNPVGHAVDSSELATKIGGNSNADTTNVTHYVKIEIPKSVGNEIQGDSIAFDLVWTAEQARNNDDPESLTPTSVQDWTDLDAVRNDLDGDYVLVNDIDANSGEYGSLVDTGDGWDPIGSRSDPFTGTFDGCGNEISDLTISESAFFTGARGLFAAVDAEIRNVSLTDVDLDTGANGGGALVATQQGGAIENVHVQGKVAGTQYIGGLAGEVLGSVAECSVDATVDAALDQAGGIAGAVVANGTIVRSYAAGDVEGSRIVGGLAGILDRGTVENSYALGNVTSTSNDGKDTGGLIGRTLSYQTTASINRSYTATEVANDGGDDAGGFIGWHEGDVTDGYWDEDVSGQSSAVDTVEPGSTSDITGLTTGDMQGGSATSNMGGLDFSSVWETVSTSDPDATGDGYPILQALDRDRQLEAQGVLDS